MIAWTEVRGDPTRARAAAMAAGAAVVATLVGTVGPDLPQGLSLCPTHALLAIDCPACGATRGVHELLGGDVAAALSHNVLLVVVVPLVAMWWIGRVRAAAGRPAFPLPRVGRSTWVGVLVVLTTFAVVRNLALPGLAWLDAA